jgi:peroxiredoxin
MVNVLKVTAVAILIMVLVPAPFAQGPGPCVIKGPPNLDFTLKDLNGKDVKLSAYKKDKVLLVNFWATWCIPCRTEIPGFINLYNRYKGRGLEIVGVVVDDTEAAVKPYVRDMKMNYPVLLEQGHAVHEAYSLIGMPTTILINRDGTTCEQHVGFTRRSTFEDAIKKLL